MLYILVKLKSNASTLKKPPKPKKIFDIEREESLLLFVDEIKIPRKIKIFQK